MSDVVKLYSRAEIEEEAAAWVWRLDSGTLTASERDAFEAWLRQDPRNARALAELSRAWSALDELGQRRHEQPTSVPAHTLSRLPARSGWKFHRGWAAAAAIILAVVGAAWLSHRDQPLRLSTAIGQERNVTLADGSVVSLNTNTIVDVILARRQRQIYLRRGEAHFQVAHDRARPFLVRAGDALVRAVGTQFEVRLHSDQHVDVLVNEGRVEVEAQTQASSIGSANANQPATPLTSARAVSAGQQLSTAVRDYPVVAISPQRISSALAWRNGAIVLDGETLSEAIGEIGRYTDARIVLDPSIAGLRVGGRCRTDNVQEFLDGLPTALPVRIRRAEDGVIYVEPTL